jgi:hypothetical protein
MHSIVVGFSRVLTQRAAFPQNSRNCAGSCGFSDGNPSCWTRSRARACARARTARTLPGELANSRGIIPGSTSLMLPPNLTSPPPSTQVLAEGALEIVWVTDKAITSGTTLPSRVCGPSSEPSSAPGHARYSLHDQLSSFHAWCGSHPLPASHFCLNC